MSEKRIMNIAYGRSDHSSEGKKYWTTVGILILGQNEEGEERLSIKLNSIPLDAEFDGWFSVFPKDDNRESTAHKVHQQDPAVNQPMNEIAF